MGCGKCCMDFRILPEHLRYPEQMGEDGQEYVAAHGILVTEVAGLLHRADPLNDGSGWVTVVHRCQHLDAEQRCDIYAARPKICREFDCSLRTDHVETTAPVPILFRRNGSVN